MSEYNWVNKSTATPAEIRPGTAMAFKVACVWWEDFGAWCAYEAPSNWDDQNVIEHGNEIDKKAADLMFPAMAQVAKTNKLVYYNP